MIWDRLAREKGPMRAAWDEDHDDTPRHVDFIEAAIDWTVPGPIVEFGAGPGRLNDPVQPSWYWLKATR